MPTVQIADEKKYGKALSMLIYEIGGLFWTKPVRRLVINPGQLQILQAAGLVPNTNGARKRGKSRVPHGGTSTGLETAPQELMAW